MSEQHEIPHTFTSFTAGIDDNGRRIDRIIRKFLKDIPMTEIYRAFRKGLIKLDGKKITPDTKVTAGTYIWLHTSLTERIAAGRNNAPQNIHKETLHVVESLKQITLFQNNHVLILNKPYGMQVHGGGSVQEKDTADYLVKTAYRMSEPAAESLSFTPGSLHRIDRNTTGLVVFSQSLTGAVRFSQLLQNGEITKQYIGIVEGVPSDGQWKDKTSRNDHTHISNADEDGKETVTDIQPLATDGKLTLAQFTIHTGRTHQIRLQCSLHGHPLAGDIKYGGKKISSRYFLHSWQMIFPAQTGLFNQNSSLEQPVIFTAPPPQDFQTEISKRFAIDLLVSSGNPAL